MLNCRGYTFLFDQYIYAFKKKSNTNKNTAIAFNFETFPFKFIEFSGFLYITTLHHFHILSNFIFTLQSGSEAQTRRPASRVFTTNIKTAANSDFNCPDEFGYYPHPTDCSQYYVCVFGGALLESCTGGLMYSHELRKYFQERFTVFS